MNYHERIGLAIERAAEKLPHGYEIVLAIETDAGSVSLFIPPVSDDEGGRMVDEWGESDLADNVNKAVDMAIEHYDRLKMDGVFIGCVTKETNALRPPTPVGWSDTDWIKHLEEREAHPLECVHINQGSMDAYADAYEAEYNEWKATSA